MKRLIIYFIFTGMVLSCNKDEFSDMNQDPSKVNQPDLTYLFTQALYKLDDTYTEWFYDNAQYVFPWTQTTVNATGNTGDVAQDKEHGNRSGAFYADIMPVLTEIREFVDNRFTGKEQIAYQYIKYVTYPVQIMQAMKITDMYGSLAYSEACMARYTNPPLLTPVLDNQEALFTQWDNELKKTVEVLTTDQTFEGQSVNQVSLGKQDFIYNGDFNTWARFANSLRLRIASRLVNTNKELALRIVNEIVASPAGLIEENTHNFYWVPASDYFHFQNDIWFGVGGKNLIDFLRNNQDPRLRFLFSKNDYNSKVIQGFFNAGKEIPSYILENVNYHEEVLDGKTIKIFDSWKGPGEPWVRYYGAPTAPDAKKDAALNNQYFITENFKLENKTYSPTSYYNEKNVVSNINEIYPDIPGVSVEHKDDVPYHSLLFSAAEVNLYLAEFKLLGAAVPGDANTYFRKAITQSVNSLNKLAKDNDLLYYQEAYDKEHEVTIELKSGELDALLQKPACSLTGNVAEDLEKVYIQQFINDLNNPNELFVTSRRTGIPKTGSNILPREPFNDGGVGMIIPRRFTIKNPTEDDINFQNKLKAIQEQGFTPGNSEPQILHDQRIWYDKTAPDWGTGPQL